MNAPPPLRLRPSVGIRIGTTAFFRNRAFLRVLLDELDKVTGSEVRVLVHAASIGAEAYSLGIALLSDPRFEHRSVRIDATDIEPAFVRFAGAGRYPAEVAAGLGAGERSWFRRVDDKQIEVGEKLRECVRFLEASSVQAFETTETYDAVLVMNALIYVDAAGQRQAIDRIAGYNRGVLGLTAFHMDSIRADLEPAGYAPVTREIAAIHDGWTDRRVRTAGPELRPGVIFHSWSLPEFSEIADWEYRYCSIFRKQDAGASSDLPCPSAAASADGQGGLANDAA